MGPCVNGLGWSAQDSVEGRLATFGGSFKINWANTTDVTRTTLRIVKRFDVVENVLSRLLSGILNGLLDSLFLQASKE